MRLTIGFLIAVALPAAPAAAAAADPDAVCSVAMMDLAVRAEKEPALDAEFRTSLPRWAELFSGMLVERYDDVRLRDAVAAASVDYLAARNKKEVVRGCLARIRTVKARMEAAVERARAKVLGPPKNSNRPR